MQEELTLPRTWFGDHLNGVPGYRISIDDKLIIEISLPTTTKQHVVALIAKPGETLQHWTNTLPEMLQWVADTLGVPLVIEDEEAVYPTDTFDDGDDGDYKQEDFEDGDDGYDEEEDEDDAEVYSDGATESNEPQEVNAKKEGK